MNTRRIFIRTCAAAALVTAFAAPAGAQTAFPNKPIRVLVGFAPGGGTDIVARALGVKMSEILGQPIVVENRAGASGTIAAAEVARSAPDGYTLLMGHSNSNAIAPFVLDKVPYDAGTDFSPITYVGYVPNVLVVHPSIPARTVPELIALAKGKPGEYTYASSGVGSTQHLAGALFAKLTDVQLNHIPYKGSGQAVVDLIGGQVNMNFDTMPPVLEHIKSGKLRALAISTPQRLSQLPDVPTFSEVGIKGFEVTNWYSVMGPKGLPADVVSKIDDAVKKSMNDPSIRASLVAQGVQFGGAATPSQFSDFIKAELAKYQKLVKDLNVKAN
ncbi:MAG TPA: tripartite tricarboxylate transporter substrate binding protein [Burkholderiaceae bacterium]|jgi:tripartite-type tricarboxylate transporter receptor subunit TctC|nr:tripartite tricarboxylate transporter substrate binding protein [Burkholderiaceae bacterium]